jgi:major histocompatibility complex class I
MLCFKSLKITRRGKKTPRTRKKKHLQKRKIVTGVKISVNGESVDKTQLKKRGVVAHAFNPSTWEAEAGRFLSLRPAWSTK